MPYADPDVRRAYYNEWKRGDKKRLSNKFYDAAKHANARAEAEGAEGRITTADARAVLSVGRCFYCGSGRMLHSGRGPSADTLGIDHRVPLSEGGRNEAENLVACCHGCNASKGPTDRPHRWSRLYDICQECGGAERPHMARGLCSRCYQHDYERRHPGRRAK